nr:GGDEF domain-containing protein [Motilibacter deserti]
MDAVVALAGPVFLHGPDPAWIWRRVAPDGFVLVAGNAPAEALTGAGLAGMQAAVHGLLRQPGLTLRADLGRCLDEQAGIAADFEARSPLTGEFRHLLVSHVPLTEEHVLTLVRNVTELRAQLAAERRLSSDLEQLASLSRAILEADDPQQARDMLCSGALMLAEADGVFLAEQREGTLSATARAVAPGMPSGQQLRVPRPDERGSVTREVFDTGIPVFLPDLAAHPQADPELVRASGAASGFFHPVVAGGSVVGVLVVAWRTAVPEPPQRVRRLMPLLSADAALAISRADLVAQLAAAATQDALTGLPNRRAADTELARFVARASRARRPLTVAVLDVNGLKSVNDQQGHAAGDALLQDAARCWRTALRREDQLARIGGDEFVVLMPDTDEAAGQQVIARLRASAPSVSVAVGVAEWAEGQTAGELLAAADRQMYADKAGSAG